MKCHILDPSGNESTINLIHPRTYSAAVALTDNLLWVTGGTGHPTSTEFIDLSLNSEISRLGPDLPIGFDRGAYTYDIEPIQHGLYGGVASFFYSILMYTFFVFILIYIL